MKFSRICCLLFSYQCSLFCCRLKRQHQQIITSFVVCQQLFYFFCFAFVILSITFKRQLIYFITSNNLLSRTFFKFFLCIFHLTLSISRQGCPVFSILHRLSQRRRLSYHLVFELSTFFLFFIYFAQFRQFTPFTNTVYKISFFYFHAHQTYYYPKKLLLFTIIKNLSLSDYTCLIYYRQRKAFLL